MQEFSRMCLDGLMQFQNLNLIVEGPAGLDSRQRGGKTSGDISLALKYEGLSFRVWRL